MTFFKLCKYDLKNGMFKEGIKYLACVVLFLGFCIGFIYTKALDPLANGAVSYTHLTLPTT